MHEGSFTEQIVEAIRASLGQRLGDPPKEVRVRVGEVFHLVPEAVQMHYALLTKGTGLEGVSLVLEEVPLKVECKDCGQSGPVEDHHLLICSHCGSLNVLTFEGGAIEVLAAEPETP